MAFKQIEQVAELGKDINKVNQNALAQDEGVVSDLLPELKLNMKDEELIDLKNQWIKN